MRGGGPAEAKRAMPREGLCRILSWFLFFFAKSEKVQVLARRLAYQRGGLASWVFVVVFHD